MKNMPKDRRAVADRIQMDLAAAGLVAAGARALVVVIAPHHGDYVAVTAPAGAESDAWSAVLSDLPWNVLVEQAHAGSQGTTFRVRPDDK